MSRWLQITPFMLLLPKIFIVMLKDTPPLTKMSHVTVVLNSIIHNAQGNIHQQDMKPVEYYRHILYTSIFFSFLSRNK